MSSSVLYQRLGELTDAGLIGRDGEERYVLTTSGRTLKTAIEPLDRWARRWAEPG